METTKVFTQCLGKIQSSGFCDRCGQLGGQTTSSICGRLNEVSSESAPLATDNTLPETISKSDGSGTIEIHPEVKKLAIAWIENYTPNGSIMPEIAQKFKLAEDIQRILDTQGEQERQKAIQECIDFIKDWYENERALEEKSFYVELEKLKG